MLFSAEFREIKQIGIAADPWVTFEIPRGTRAQAKSGRTVYSTTFDEPRRIPAAGHVTVNFRDKPALVFKYGDTSPVIATVRSKAVDTDAPPANIKALGYAAGRPIGLCRVKMPTGDEFKSDFEGFDNLPDEKWLQLNNSEDRFTIQVKLKKMLPEDVYRDLGGGAFYVYGVVRFVVHVQAPPKDDRHKALEI